MPALRENDFISGAAVAYNILSAVCKALACARNSHLVNVNGFFGMRKALYKAYAAAVQLKHRGNSAVAAGNGYGIARNGVVIPYTGNGMLHKIIAVGYCNARCSFLNRRQQSRFCSIVQLIFHISLGCTPCPARFPQHLHR